MILSILLQLFVLLFNKTSMIEKKIYFQVSDIYQLEFNVSDIKLLKKI